MIREIQAKTLLSTVKTTGYDVFGLKYNMNLYRGCQHACIYCDSRSKCYQLGDLADIRMKANALQLLEKELRGKKAKGTIGFGSMNDPYMAVEEIQLLSRKALEIIARYRFPVHIKTKSDLVCRDIDLLRSISSVYAAVSVTITTTNDSLAAIIEPGAPVSSKRFDAIKKLSEAGIYCGVCLMPVLPFITDNPDNIKKVLEKAKESGASYVLGFMGMTLREGQREFYYRQLDKHFPGLTKKYLQQYGNLYEAAVPGYNELENVYYKTCRELNLRTKMDFYKPEEKNDIQLKIFLSYRTY